MKKTLLLTHEYYPFRGGIGRYCYDLFSHFSSEEYLVATDQKEIDARSNVIRVKLLSSYVKPRWIRGVFSTMRLVKRESIRMIITPHILPLGIIAYYVYRFTGTPYVISLHGLDINLAKTRHYGMTRTILRHAHHIIVNSEATRSLLAGLFIKTPITVITPSVNAEHLTVDEQLKNELREKYKNKKIILTVGRLIKRKGQDMMIRAMAEIIKKVPEAYYVIIGAGSQQPYLESLIDTQGADDYVEIKNDVKDSELGAYYSVSSVFIMASRKRGPDIEGYGIVFLEAAMFGLPIITGNSGGETEAVGGSQNAVVIDGSIRREVVDAVEGLLSDSDFSDYLGNSVKRYVESLPSIDHKVMKLKKLLS